MKKLIAIATILLAVNAVLLYNINNKLHRTPDTKPVAWTELVEIVQLTYAAAPYPASGRSGNIYVVRSEKGELSTLDLPYTLGPDVTHAYVHHLGKSIQLTPLHTKPLETM